MNKAMINSMIRMNKAHDEKISFWPASGSIESVSHDIPVG